MILVDENIDDQITQAIRAMGIEVYSIAEKHSGIGDEQIVELSKEPPRIILTEDKDFGEWVFSHGVKGISVILLRYRFKDRRRMVPIVTDLLHKRIHNLVGKFTVVTVDKIRIRDLK